MSEDFDKTIAGLEENLESLKAEMAAARSAWLAELSPRVAGRWVDYAQATVTEQADHANELGAEAIRSIKAEVTSLADNAEALARRRLVEEGSEIWPDLAPQTNPSERRFGGSGPGSGFKVADFFFEDDHYKGRPVNGPDPLEGPVGQLLAEVEPILRQQGFETGESRRPGIGGLNWDRELAEKINPYGELHEKYIETLRMLANTRAAKAKAEAQTLWDDA